ncbi:TetR/AcrR family transcriptional regulator [Luminiphilus syltensis]|uniref:TetR/AcrR family transcriptional regulator n=1 Tax=Luminiphilus syltensis TaxID=1341119 RepID=UPI0002EB758B|nr:TetR/AcrR family transcriptional regulator [Luminiphilus syltensis]
MGTRETKSRILDAALELFNTSSTSDISANRVAEAAGISRGNLHYHYASKEEIVLDLWNRIEAEMGEWSKNPMSPTLENMALMALRQFRLIWRYRFFYQELNVLLERDTELRYRFTRARQKRMEDVFVFFRQLANAGFLRSDLSDRQLRRLIKISWLVSDFWLSFVRVEDEVIDIGTMEDGFKLIVQLFEPVMTDRGKRGIPLSLRAFSLDPTDFTQRSA